MTDKPVVKLVVGDTGRQRGRSAKAAPSGEAAASVMAWACTWLEDRPGPLLADLPDEPDLLLSASPDDAAAIKRGELAPSVAFMQGRLKTAGDNALLLRVLRWSAGDDFTVALGHLGSP